MDELGKLGLAEKTSTNERTQREDVFVREQDSKPVRRLANSTNRTRKSRHHANGKTQPKCESANGSSPSSFGAYAFRLYIAGGAPNSVRAVRNFDAISQKHFPFSPRIEVVDVLREPLRALAEPILVTPTLVKISPPPEQQIIGDLSDDGEVLAALNWPNKEIS